eukprot:5217062-Amphidinium_carterae.1
MGSRKEATLLPKDGKLRLLSHRFGIKQGNKLRAVDDLSESQVNSAFALREKIEFLNLDVLTAFVRKLYVVLLSGSVNFTLVDGSTLCGIVDQAWVQSTHSLLRRVLDL